jgi:alpha-galactosidase
MYNDTLKTISVPLFRREVHFRKAARRIGLALSAVTWLVGAGCQSKQESKTPAPTPAPKSVIEVTTGSEGITFRTPSAKFILGPSGRLIGSLGKTGNSSSLDAQPNDAGQTISVANKEYPGVQLDLVHAEVREPSGKLGRLGKQVTVRGQISGVGLEETITLEVYDAFPQLALLSATLRNTAGKDIVLDSVTLQRHIFAPLANSQGSQPLWSFDGASLKWGKDEIFPVPAKYAQENPFGAPVPVKDDLGHVGGGIPVVAFWSREVGEAIGHIETLPLVISLPVETKEAGKVAASVRIPAKTTLKPGEVFSTPRTFLAVYSGDFYQPLSVWSNVIEKEGLSKPANNDENYAVNWCGWGYEFAVTPKQMLETVPKLKELGIHWATLDDGWFNNYGDWQPRQAAFPGDAMQDMVHKFHDHGIKLQLWWLPLAVEDGRNGYGGRKFTVSQVVKDHPDWLILDQSGKPARMARNLAVLCPALPEVQAYYKQLTERFVRDWGFDGHKLDNIYTTPPCYNPTHHHKSPNDSVYAMGEVYKTIFETTRALKPNSVTQSCPCGTPPSLAWLRYMDQAVTADPVGSLQVRRRIKMYKALLGPHAAVYGDHVELTRITNTFTDNEQDLGTDFASTLGTGGVLGTKFTWPDYGPKFKNVFLTPEKDAHWKEWIHLYNDKMLSKGNFLDLYVYGFDVPEAYAIEKDDKMYYAFYAPSSSSSKIWNGEVELRGLGSKTYRVVDYVHHQDLGAVIGPTARLKVSFPDSLLLEAAPAP